MGFGILGSFLVLTLFFSPLLCQVPNTDESFVADFLQKMGLDPSKDHRFSGPFCSWKTVSCDAKGENVLKLHLSALGLSGVIPENTIGKLAKLESLDLSCNKITALPSDFWSLGSLYDLNLSHNEIVENLSSNIGNFGKLQALDLSYNSFSGDIPEAISSLTSLQAMNLSHNGFESLVPFGLLQCRSLVSIDLSENKLSGSLPNGFDAAFPRLTFLNLARNQLTGWDSDFSELKLTCLNISGNLFKGSAVGFFRRPLRIIDLSKNQLEGHVSEVNLSSNFSWSDLIHLDLSENKLSGVFFADFGRAENLKYLNLACNRFSRQPLLNVNMLVDLEYLNLSSTNLIGGIPSDVSHLSRLSALDLSKNRLSGHVPPLSTKKLRALDLSRNNLTGEIPTVLLAELTDMEKFNFSYNNLSFCGSKFPNETLQSSFLGSVNICPIAANPAFFERKPSSHRTLKLALALGFSMILLLLGLLLLAFRCRRKTQTQAQTWAPKPSSYKEEETISGPFSFHTGSTTWVADVRQATSVPVIIFEKPLLNLTFADLLSSTSHFDRGTLLADGRFGPVYGGVLPGGVHVAVRVLVHGSTLTDQDAARELEFLGRIKHPNLVPLTGYCLAGEQRIAIYDYMENGSLENLLYDLPLGVRTADEWTNDAWEADEENGGIRFAGPEGLATSWRFRHKIALGTARALAFLHHGCSPPIVHRDVRASSVYLDSDLEPRLSDFGLAKAFGNNNNGVGGSTGYVPPELLDRESSGSDPTPKSDVYGFGVVLFELITAKRPADDDYFGEKATNLVDWVRGFVRRNEGSSVIDPKIGGTGLESQIVEALKIGYLCTAEAPSKRPTMQQVVGLLKDLDAVIKP